MIKTVTLVISLLFASASFASETPPQRLIEFPDGSRKLLTEDEILDLAFKQHRETGRCGGFMDITDNPNEPFFGLDATDLFFEPRELKNKPLVNSLLQELSADRLQATVRGLSGFHTRYYQSEIGKDAALWLKSQYESYGTHRADIKVETYNHSSFKQPSVIARIQGKGPKADEIIVIGGHLDSVNWSFSDGAGADNRAPGADDNASGTSTVLEVFRVLAQSGYQPDRTIEFMGYAAEEVGLVGSREISQAYKAAGKKVVAVLQFDMTMYPGAAPQITLINDQVDNGLTAFLKQIIDEYVKVPWKEEPCGYGCSDHASWTRAGFPSAFPFEAPVKQMNGKIHSSKDLFENGMSHTHGLHFAKIGLAFAVELATENAK